MAKHPSSKEGVLSRRGLLSRTAQVGAGFLLSCLPGLGCRKQASATRRAPPRRRVQAKKATCAPTQDNIEGPFYCKNAPWRTQIASKQEPGKRLRIQGKILQQDCKTPLSGAIIEIWHADAKGNYDNSCQNATGPKTYRLRARLKANAKGEYQYDTIIPGRYLNGSQYRPAHVHYHVEAQGYRPLTTQLYFSGDPYIKGDPFVKSSLIIKLKSQGKRWEGRFDVVLKKK